MKSIHVLRKPCSEPTVAINVLGHGTGVLNVDGCRVGAPFVSAGGNNFDAWRLGEDRTDRPPAHGTANFKVASGRWPANLILQHLEDCQSDGDRQVLSTSGKMAEHHRRNAPLGANGIYGRGDLRGMKPTCYVAEDGTETVAAWTCAEGCPVAALDTQSGELTSGSWNGHRNKAKTKPGIYAPFVLRDEVGTQGSKGGASRFFKQVKP